MGIRIDWSWIIPIIVVAIILYLIIGGVIILRAEALCLEQGFPSSSVTWNLKSYCISLYDAKPIVVPLVR